MSMHNLRPLAGDDSPQRPDCLRIRKRWHMPTLGFTEKPCDALCSAADPIHPHPSVDFKPRQSLAPKSCNSHVVSAFNQCGAEGPNVLLFASNSGRIELCEHQNAHSMAKPSIAALAYPHPENRAQAGRTGIT